MHLPDTIWFLYCLKITTILISNYWFCTFYKWNHTECTLVSDFPQHFVCEIHSHYFTELCIVFIFIAVSYFTAWLSVYSSWMDIGVFFSFFAIVNSTDVTILCLLVIEYMHILLGIHLEMEFLGQWVWICSPLVDSASLPKWLHWLIFSPTPYKKYGCFTPLSTLVLSIFLF